MKKILITTALVFAGTAAMAADFDNNSVDLVLERDNVTLGVSTLDGEPTDLSLSATVLPYTIMGLDADLTLGAKYGIQSEDFNLSAEYELSKNISKLNVNAAVKADYTIASGANDGVWAVTPSVGAKFNVNNKLSAFGDVSYEWDASNDWARAGGAVEAGARYALTDDLAITPSLVRTFDTGADETNLNVKVALRF
jgi:opacity protein-like surface antigen